MTMPETRRKRLIIRSWSPRLVAAVGLSFAFLAVGQVAAEEKKENDPGKPKVHKLYRCMDGEGKPTFSDKPCGPDAVAQDLRVRPAAPALGERCMAENDQDACLQLNRLRRENHEAWRAEMLAGREAMRRKYERQRELAVKIQECIRNNERLEYQTRRQLDWRTRQAIRERCRVNPD